MTTLLTALFYLWLVITILLVAMWILREQDRRRNDQRDLELEDKLLADAELNSDPEQDEPVTETQTEPEVDSQTEAEVDSQTEAEAEVEVDSQTAAETDFESESDTETDPTPDEAAETGIAELLDGITLPLDLTPQIDRVEDKNLHTIFVSEIPDAAEVGTAFADELAKVGFEIEPAGFDQALATRGEDLLSMRISPDAGLVTDGSVRRYPRANETDVVIEVWVGNGSPPPLSD